MLKIWKEKIFVQTNLIHTFKEDVFNDDPIEEKKIINRLDIFFIRCYESDFPCFLYNR